MPVRNISGLGPTKNVKPIIAHHLIPPVFAPVYKVELVGTNTYDVTEYIAPSVFSDGVTDNIGSFDFVLIDPNQTYSNNIANFDQIKIYLDYGATATTLRFTGIIESNYREGIYYKVSGRSIGMKARGKNIIYSATNKARSTVLTEIIEANFTFLDTSNIETDNTLITVNYSEKPFEEIITELCGKHHEFYIDHSENARFFTRGSKINTTEAIVQGYNHVSTEDYGSDSEEVVTRVRVYGRKQGDIALFATSSSTTSHTSGIVKEKKINDESIITTTEATERADAEYAALIQEPKLGVVTSLLLPTLAPGEKLSMFVPQDEITEGQYLINSFTHKLPILNTVINVQQKKVNIPQIIKKNIVTSTGLSEQDNPNDLDFSNIITFENDSGTHSNTVINENYLKVEIGQSTGQWISDLIELSANVDAIAFKITGDFLIGQYDATSTNLWFSLDGGTTWRYYDTTIGTTTVPTGRDLKIRIDLNSTTSKVKAVAVQYSLSS